MTVADALTILRLYPSATPLRYDWPPCELGPVTHEDIVRTRFIHSRISEAEGRWFIDSSRTWDWHRIPQNAALIDADPEVPGDLYDEASALYDYFSASRPWGVSTAKISKVLHLKYPGLVPILDQRLLRLYSRPARAAALTSDRWRHRTGTLTWEAIRQDLLLSDMAALRSAMAAESTLAPLARLTDLRLLDALAWQD